MGKRRRARERQPPADSPPPDSAQVDERVRSSRLEILLQAEAVVARAMTYAMHVGHGDERYWPGRVARTDRFEVRITEEAVELATERLSMACSQIGVDIAKELRISPDARRGRYRVLERTPRSKPEPPGWCMPSEDELLASPAHMPIPSAATPGIDRPADDDPST